jgi:magnesium-transporting ATPase (P-type)
MKRNDMEADLTFQGLIIFRNELRPDSAETIAALKVSEERKGERLGA